MNCIGGEGGVVEKKRKKEKKKGILFHPRKCCRSLLSMNERRPCSLWMLPGCWLGSVFPIVCVSLLLEAGRQMRGWYTAHVHMEDCNTVSVLLSQRTTFKWLSFTSLHRLKLYICIYIYKPINKVSWIYPGIHTSVTNSLYFLTAPPLPSHCLIDMSAMNELVCECAGWRWL